MIKGKQKEEEQVVQNTDEDDQEVTENLCGHDKFKFQLWVLICILAKKLSTCAFIPF